MKRKEEGEFSGERQEEEVGCFYIRGGGRVCFAGIRGFSNNL